MEDVERGGGEWGVVDGAGVVTQDNDMLAIM